MKAAIYTKYDTPDVIKIKDVQTPTPSDHEVRIRVHAVSLNYADYALLTGKPFLVRASNGLFKPKHQILGSDLSGVVESVGARVTDFVPGDHVVADQADYGLGSLAEYICVPSSRLAKKPESLSHEIAATLPLAGCTALQGLRDHGQLQSGQKVLIIGASGGVGSLAAQVAKALGANVTILCRTKKLAPMKTLGIDRIINTDKESLSDLDEKYDIIFDCAAYLPAKTYKHLLQETGTYIIVGGSMKHLFKILLFGSFMSKKSGTTYKSFLSKGNKKDTEILLDMASKGLLTPLIYETYPFEKTAEAFKAYKSRESYGKIVVTIP